MIIAKLFSSTIKNFLKLYFFAIILVIGFGTILTVVSLNQKNKEIDKKIIETSNRISKLIGRDIDHVKYQLFYASSQIASNYKNDKKVEQLLSTFLTNINNQVDIALSWNAFSWIDAQDNLIIDGTSGILSKKINIENRDYLQSTKKYHNKIIFGKPVYGALSQRYIIPTALGTYTAKGEYIGTLVFGFDVEKILEKIEEETKNENIGFAFFKNGEFIFASENFNHENFESIKKEIEILALDEKIDRKKISSQRFFLQKGFNSYFQKIKGYPIEIVIFYDQDAYNKEMFDVLFKQIFLAFIIAIACALLFRTLYRKIVKPVAQLSKFAQKISNHDFSYQIEKPQSEELYELYIALTKLKESIIREDELLKKLKNANQKIAQENFNKSEFLSSISHDIRNPLSAIISLLEAIKNDEIDKNEALQEIDICANDSLQFISDLMDVAQASSGIFSINMSQKINIAEMIERSIRINRDFANKKRILIVNNIKNNLPLINLDQRRIKQILINIINNSIKYSRQNTKIEIFADCFSKDQKEKLKIVIKDEGVGMNQKQITKALEKFGLLDDKKYLERIDSFGLGLNLVKQLIELQNGKINIESKIGEGTVVTIIFEYLQ